MPSMTNDDVAMAEFGDADDYCQSGVLRFSSLSSCDCFGFPLLSYMVSRLPAQAGHLGPIVDRSHRLIQLDSDQLWVPIGRELPADLLASGQRVAFPASVVQSLQHAVPPLTTASVCGVSRLLIERPDNVQTSCRPVVNLQKIPVEQTVPQIEIQKITSSRLTTSDGPCLAEISFKVKDKRKALTGQNPDFSQKTTIANNHNNLQEKYLETDTLDNLASQKNEMYAVLDLTYAETNKILQTAVTTCSTRNGNLSALLSVSDLVSVLKAKRDADVNSIQSFPEQKRGQKPGLKVYLATADASPPLTSLPIEDISNTKQLVSHSQVQPESMVVLEKTAVVKAQSNLNITPSQMISLKRKSDVLQNLEKKMARIEYRDVNHANTHRLHTASQRITNVQMNFKPREQCTQIVTTAAGTATDQTNKQQLLLQSS